MIWAKKLIKNYYPIYIIGKNLFPQNESLMTWGDFVMGFSLTSLVSPSSIDGCQEKKMKKRINQQTQPPCAVSSPELCSGVTVCLLNNCLSIHFLLGGFFFFCLTLCRFFDFFFFLLSEHMKGLQVGFK